MIKGIVLALSLLLMGGQYLPMGSRPIASGGGSNPTLVHSETNNFGCTGSGNACAYVLPNNPTSGNKLEVFANTTALVTGLSGSGAGCPTSFTSGATAATASPTNLYSFIGTVPATGACTLNFVLTSFDTTGVTVAEVSGTSGIDATGSASSCGTSCTATASSATTSANDLALTYWASNASSPSAAASGWTSLINNSFDGLFDQSVPTLGTTVSFVSTGTTLTNSAAIVVVLKP